MEPQKTQDTKAPDKAVRKWPGRPHWFLAGLSGSLLAGVLVPLILGSFGLSMFVMFILIPPAFIAGIIIEPFIKIEGADPERLVHTLWILIGVIHILISYAYGILVSFIVGKYLCKPNKKPSDVSGMTITVYAVLYLIMYLLFLLLQKPDMVNTVFGL